MSKLVLQEVQLGTSGTATHNFVFKTNVDGTMALSRGNSGATTQDVFHIDALGNITFDAAQLIKQNSKASNYTLVYSDGGKHIFHPGTDTTARTWTIPSNATVPYAVGTVITFVNQFGAGNITIAINSDTLRMAGASGTGSRTLVANGMASALKVSATEWMISGNGIA